MPKQAFSLFCTCTRHTFNQVYRIRLNMIKVDLYCGWDSDATSNEIVAMEKTLLRNYCFFCRVATIVFSDFDMISDGNYSATVVIYLKG